MFFVCHGEHVLTYILGSGACGGRKLRTYTHTYTHTHTHTHGITTVTIIKIICSTKDKQRSFIYGSTEARMYTYTKPLNIKHMH